MNIIPMNQLQERIDESEIQNQSQCVREGKKGKNTVKRVLDTHESDLNEEEKTTLHSENAFYPFHIYHYSPNPQYENHTFAQCTGTVITVYPYTHR